MRKAFGRDAGGGAALACEHFGSNAIANAIGRAPCRRWPVGEKGCAWRAMKGTSIDINATSIVLETASGHVNIPASAPAAAAPSNC